MLISSSFRLFHCGCLYSNPFPCRVYTLFSKFELLVAQCRCQSPWLLFVTHASSEPHMSGRLELAPLVGCVAPRSLRLCKYQIFLCKNVRDSLAHEIGELVIYMFVVGDFKNIIGCKNVFTLCKVCSW